MVELVAAHGGLEYAREKAPWRRRSARTTRWRGCPRGPVLEALHDSVVYAVERRR
jgi:hypothetical protein